MISYVPPKPSPLAPGYHLDRYELLCPIAEGGMGAVWLARQRGKYGFQKLVALKTILPSFAAEADFRVLFLDEARLASRIDHTNVAQVLDLGEEHDVLYLVIEWVEGDSLHKLARTVARKSLALPQAILLRVLSDACSGLHAAHELRDAQGKHLGVVHRDVSPQNILVNVHGTSKVIDFGIAKACDRLTQETRLGVVKGKLEYMSPEQALGLAVDVRADIWAIGAVFYRIVTGKAPYDASNPISTMELLRSGHLPEPLSAMPGVHPAVCAVITRALAPRAAQRFANAAELHDAFQVAMVEAGAYASAKDVQAFVATHLGERIHARKRKIQVALEAAAHRDKLAAVLSEGILDSIGAVPVAEPRASLAEPSQTAVTRVVMTSLDEYAVTAVNVAGANGAWIPRQAMLDSDRPPAGEVARPHDAPSDISVVWSDEAARAVSEVSVNGATVAQLAPPGLTRARPISARPRMGRTWLALMVVLGVGSVVVALTLSRAERDAVSSVPATSNIVNPVTTHAPLPAEPAILPPAGQTVPELTRLPALTGEPPSLSPATPSSAASTRPRVGAGAAPARSRPSPRGGEPAAKRVTGDGDGI